MMRQVGVAPGTTTMFVPYAVPIELNRGLGGGGLGLVDPTRWWVYGRDDGRSPVAVQPMFKVNPISGQYETLSGACVGGRCLGQSDDPAVNANLGRRNSWLVTALSALAGVAIGVTVGALVQPGRARGAVVGALAGVVAGGAAGALIQYKAWTSALPQVA